MTRKVQILVGAAVCMGAAVCTGAAAYLRTMPGVGRAWWRVCGRAPLRVVALFAAIGLAGVAARAATYLRRSERERCERWADAGNGVEDRRKGER